MIYFDLWEGMENYKMSGKSQGSLRWMISGNPDINLHEFLFVPLDVSALLSMSQLFKERICSLFFFFLSLFFWFKQYLFNIIYIVTYNTIWYGTGSDGKRIAYMKVISFFVFNFADVNLSSLFFVLFWCWKFIHWLLESLSQVGRSCDWKCLL